MSAISISHPDDVPAQQKAEAQLEGKFLSASARLAIAEYLVNLDKERFMLDFVSTGRTRAEALNAWVNYSKITANLKEKGMTNSAV